jgi:hypothetical protein
MDTRKRKPHEADKRGTKRHSWEVVAANVMDLLFAVTHDEGDDQ